MRLTFIGKSVIALVIFILILYIFPKNLVIPNASDMFTAAALLFGIIAGFFIAATLTNYFRFQSLVSVETGKLVSLYNTGILLNPTLKTKLLAAIDKYLIRAFDYELHEYIENTEKDFQNVIDVTKKVKKRDSDLFVHFLEIKGNIRETRQEIMLTSRKILGVGHWIVLIILAIVVIFLIYIMRAPGTASSIFTVLIATITCLVLFLLYDIDSNYFAEKKIGFDVYERSFLELGLLPYYPFESIKKGRIKPKGKCRIGTRIGDTNLMKRKIEVVNFKK